MAIATVFLNGIFLPAEQLSISVGDAGFIWGATVSDRMRTYAGTAFRLIDHLERFSRNCELCRVPMVFSIDDLQAIAERLVEANQSAFDGRDFMLVLFATPGERGQPTLCLHPSELNVERDRPLMERGAWLFTSPTLLVSPATQLSGVKMRSRMHWWIASQLVHDIEPGASALLLDHDGNVTETAYANFLIVRRGVVISPPRSTILPGISLQTTEVICRRLGIEFREERFQVDDCLMAEEALLTGTSFGIAGVSRVNGRPIPWPGPVLHRLQDEWSKLVGVDIRRDFLR